MWIVLQEIAEAGLPGPPLRRWEFVGTSEAPDHVATSTALRPARNLLSSVLMH